MVGEIIGEIIKLLPSKNSTNTCIFTPDGVSYAVLLEVFLISHIKACFFSCH